MFKDMLARFGKGAAKVDLVLKQSEIPLGDRLEGELNIYGGTVDQTIEGIQIEFYFELTESEKTHTHLVAVIPYQASFTIKANQQRTVPFYLNIPTDLPLSNKNIRYYFITKLQIAGAIDQSDEDEIRILPPQRLERIIHTFTQLGFRETADSRLFNGETQEFHFVPTQMLSDIASKLVFMAALETEQVRLLLEIELLTTKEERFVELEIKLPNHLMDQPQALYSYLQEAINHLAQFGKKQKQKRFFIGGLGGFAAEALGNLEEIFKKANNTGLGKFFSHILKNDK